MTGMDLSFINICTGSIKQQVSCKLSLIASSLRGGGGAITRKNLKYVFKEQIYQFITRFMTKLLCINNTGGDVEDPAQSRDFL